MNVVGAIRKNFVVPRGRGIAWQIEDVSLIVAGVEGNGAEVEDRGDQHDAVEIHAVVILQIVGEGGGAEGAVALADQEFGGVPAIVAADVDGDEFGEGLDVGIYAPEILVLGFADGVTEAGADGVDED